MRCATTWSWNTSTNGVVFHDEEFVGSYDEFEDAAYAATQRYGREPFLIRQVGALRVIRLPYVGRN